MSLPELIGTAYGISEVGRDRRKAIADLRAAFTENAEFREQAQAKLDELAAFIRVRTRQACHVTSVTHDLLSAALSEPWPNQTAA